MATLALRVFAETAAAVLRTAEAFSLAYSPVSL